MRYIFIGNILNKYHLKCIFSYIHKHSCKKHYKQNKVVDYSNLNMCIQVETSQVLRKR